MLESLRDLKVTNAHVNPNCKSSGFANGISTFFINSKPNLVIGPKTLLRNLPDRTVLNSWALDNFELADEWYRKALRRLVTFLSVSNSLCRN